jgi:cell division protease FtsH
MKTVGVWLLLLAAVWFLIWQQQPSEQTVTLPFTQLLADLDANNIAAINITGTQIAVTDHQGSRYTTSGIIEQATLEKLYEQGAQVTYGSAAGWGLTSWIGFLIPVVLLLAFLLYFLKKSRANSTNILSLRRSPHREISAADSLVTFADVGGCEEAKAELNDIIDFLKNPKPWLQAGVRLPRGVLLEGPPGCGKTLLARAVAGKPTRNSSSFPVPNSSRCLLEWVLLEFEIFSKRQSRKRLL